MDRVSDINVNRLSSALYDLYTLSALSFRTGTHLYQLAEAIRTTVVPIRILIRMTVVPIRILIRTTVCDLRSV